MSAYELQQAAATLRERAASATAGPWLAFGTDIGVSTDEACTCVASSLPEVAYGNHEDYCTVSGPVVQAGVRDITYIATVHPSVGLALADWLDHYASVLAQQSPIAFADDAVAVARLINGGAS